MRGITAPGVGRSRRTDAVAIDLPLARIAEICERYEVAELSLFGSAANGEFGPDSDDDFLVVFQHPERVGLFKMLRRPVRPGGAGW